MTDSDSEPRIIVDDDWKSQVEREKEQIQAGAEEPQDESQIPPASFLMLVQTLASQAMAGMGLFPDPMTGKPNPNLDMAKHFVDTLGIIEEKTRGNLDKQESEFVIETLHQLRMAFVSIQQEMAGGAPESTEAGPSIELP